MLLEFTPGLKGVGWGSGLSRLEEPTSSKLLPSDVDGEEEGIRIDGPEGHVIRFFRTHPDYDRIIECVNRRLLK